MNKKILASVVIGIIVVSATVIFFPTIIDSFEDLFGDDDDGDDKDSDDDDEENEVPISVPTENSIFTMEFDEAKPGYNKGDKVNTQYNETNKEFILRDKFGVFKGKYIYTRDKLTLDFYSYSPWYITFVNATHFTGVEAGKKDGGTYEWV